MATARWPCITAPPRLLASTYDTYSRTVAESAEHEQLQHPRADLPAVPKRRQFVNGPESNLFKSVQWTSDGSTLLTHSEDEGLRTFVLPDDPAAPSPEAGLLKPYSIVRAPSRVYATALHPTAGLDSPTTSVFLCSPRESPVKLHWLTHPSAIASYPLVNPTTEKFEAPYSLLIPAAEPTRFVAGTASQISIFDIHRYGEGPLAAMPTIPSRRAPATPTTMKGLVTALAANDADGVLAAGTYSRMVGLYDRLGAGECITVFWLPQGEGAGVTQLRWSADGRYIYVAERKSDVVLAYDMRNMGEVVESFRGRCAETNQRLGVEVARGMGGEVVAGGTDGVVRVWEPHKEGGAGAGDCEAMWKAHDDAVSGVALNPRCGLVATCSGQRKEYGALEEWESASESSGSGDESSEGGEARGWDNSLKIWMLPPTAQQAENALP